MRYSLLLPVIYYVSASDLSRKHARCVKRCNQLPFKVAVSARRTNCIKSCDSGAVNVDASVDTDAKSTSVVRDATCVNECSAKRGSSRYRSSCIKRCPISSDIKSVDAVLNDLISVEGPLPQEMVTSAATQIDTSATANIDSVSYLPLEDFAFKTDSTDKLETETNMTSTESPTNASNVADSTSRGLNKKRSTDETVLDKKADKLDTTGAIEASVVLNSTSNLSDEVNDLGQNEKSSTHEPRFDNENDIAVTQIDATTSNVTNLLTQIEAFSETPTDLVLKELKTNSTKNSSAAFHEAADAVPTSSTEDYSSNQNETRHEHSVLASHQHDSVSFVRDQECVNICTKKRTIKRKRDACLQRCTLNSLASILTKGYDSAKFEL